MAYHGYGLCIKTLTGNDIGQILGQSCTNFSVQAREDPPVVEPVASRYSGFAA